jgi:histone demethylase
VWACTSRQSITTISAYARYQVSTFQEAFMQEQEKTGSQRAEEEAAAARKRKRPMPTLKHGFCVDLSFEHKFRCQLQELMKLPPWTKVVSAGNMLSHIGRGKDQLATGAGTL